MARLSYAERKQKKLERKRRREEKTANALNIQNKLLTQADIKDMSTQQKIWIYTRTILIAAWPVIFYMFTPAICIAIGRVFLYASIYRDNKETVSDAMNFYSFLGICLTLLTLHFVAKKKKTSVAKEATFSLKNLNFKYILGMYGFGLCASISASAFLSLIPDSLMRGYDEMTNAAFSGYDVWFSCICILLLAPVTEEIIFRGYLLNRLLPLFKETASIWIVSILFAMFHLSIVWIVYGALLGWIMAKISIRHDNIAYSLAIHLGFNAFSAINLLIMKTPVLANTLYCSKWMFLLYGVLFTGLGYWLYTIYRKEERL